jgi:hypothetical protein
VSISDQMEGLHQSTQQLGARGECEHARSCEGVSPTNWCGGQAASINVTISLASSNIDDLFSFSITALYDTTNQGSQDMTPRTSCDLSIP